MIEEVLREVLRHLRNHRVILLPDPVEEVLRIELAQVPVELICLRQTEEDAQNGNDDLALRLVGRLDLVAARLHVAWHNTEGPALSGASDVGWRAVLGVDVREVVPDGGLSEAYQARDALALKDSAMQLLELYAVLDDLDDLLDLLQARVVLMFNVGHKELEEVRAHLVVSDGLAGYLFLLNGQDVEDAQGEA